MFFELLDEVGGRGIGVLLGTVLGSVVTWLYARQRRQRERRSILQGDARDTIVIHQHLVETAEVADEKGTRRVPSSLRIRAIGQAELNRVVPNGHLAGELLKRAFHVTSKDTLISMTGAEGSYLLETLTNFVCDRAANSSFEHELYVMAPCCEPAALAHHQPITILLVRMDDLKLFKNWTDCRQLRVEHGSDGARILTLLEMARRFEKEQATIEDLRKQGKRTAFVETMYILDLALDRRSAALTVKGVPWGRFENILKELNLDAR